MDNPLDALRVKVGHALGCGQINPLEQETVERLKEEGLDFTPYLPPTQEK